MGKIDLTIHKEALVHNIQKAKENNIIIPTIAQMQNPETDPREDPGQAQGRGTVGREPAEPVPHHLEERGQGERRPVPGRAQLRGDPLQPLRRALPDHRHGGQVVPHRLPQGGRLLRLPGPPAGHRQFDATYHKAVWPSTGNYCRGGAFNSKLLACDSVAILPAEMSKERFDWLKSIAGEVIATPGLRVQREGDLRQDPGS